MVRLVSALCALAMVAAACGDSGGSDSESSAGGSSDSDCVRPVPTAGGDPGVVVEYAIADVVVHVLECVEYSTYPPTGGDHFGAWQNCGFYTAPLVDEVAVHSLEHGAVWVTYRPGTDAATLEAMSLMTLTESHLLVSPYEGQHAPIVLSAWGRQLGVESWDSPEVASFLERYLGRSSPTAPEPGVSCSGAVGDPPDDPFANYAEIFVELA